MWGMGERKSLNTLSIQSKSTLISTPSMALVKGVELTARTFLAFPGQIAAGIPRIQSPSRFGPGLLVSLAGERD